MLPPFAKNAALYPVTEELRVYFGSKQSARHPVTDELRIYFEDAPCAGDDGYGGDAWYHAKRRSCYAPAMLLPPSENFTCYQWPVRGREILAIQIGIYPEQQTINFCEHLVIQGAALVRVLFDEREPFARFIPEENYVAA